MGSGAICSAYTFNAIRRRHRLKPYKDFGFEFWVDNSAASLSFYGYFNCLWLSGSFVIITKGLEEPTLS